MKERYAHAAYLRGKSDKRTGTHGLFPNHRGGDHPHCGLMKDANLEWKHIVYCAGVDGVVFFRTG